jgi:hypothetical protein
MVGTSIFFNRRIEQLAALAARHTLPVIYPFREFVLAGGLMSYGTGIGYAVHQAGVFGSFIASGFASARLTEGSRRNACRRCTKMYDAPWSPCRGVDTAFLPVRCTLKWPHPSLRPRIAMSKWRPRAPPRERSRAYFRFSCSLSFAPLLAAIRGRATLAEGGSHEAKLSNSRDGSAAFGSGTAANRSRRYRGEATRRAMENVSGYEWVDKVTSVHRRGRPNYCYAS